MSHREGRHAAPARPRPRDPGLPPDDLDEFRARPSGTASPTSPPQISPQTSPPPPHRSRVGWSHTLVAVLCALLGFALVAQLSQAEGDNLSSLRQDELVRLLDEITQRNEELSSERADLLAARDELLSGVDSRRVAEEAAAERALVEGILAGTVPVQGTGITMVVEDPDVSVRALTLFNVLEELRNAGAEAVELSGKRLTASSWFTDAADGVIVDGTPLSPPYEWTAIGDPQTMAVALDIPGGALASIRNAGGSAEIEELDAVEIRAVREITTPEFATPVPTPSPTS